MDGSRLCSFLLGDWPAWKANQRSMSWSLRLCWPNLLEKRDDWQVQAHNSLYFHSFIWEQENGAALAVLFPIKWIENNTRNWTAKSSDTQKLDSYDRGFVSFLFCLWAAVMNPFSCVSTLNHCDTNHWPVSTYN